MFWVVSVFKLCHKSYYWKTELPKKKWPSRLPLCIHTFICDYVNHETTMAHWSMYTFCHTKNTTAQFFVGSLVCLQCPLPIRHSHSAHSSSPPSRVSPYGVWFGLGIAGLHRAGIKHHAGAPGMHKDHIYTNRALPVLTQSWTSV